jgi:hypothetical protein
MDINRPPPGTQPSNQTIECFLCSYSLIYRGNRFCSDRCRAAFDAGFSRLDPNQARAFCALPLDRLRVVAGPPGLTTGASFYAPFLAAAEAARRRRKVRNGPRSINSISVENRPAKSRRCKSTSGEARSTVEAPRR